jgi:hypothetical protein
MSAGWTALLFTDHDGALIDLGSKCIRREHNRQVMSLTADTG